MTIASTARAAAALLLIASGMAPALAAPLGAWVDLGDVTQGSQIAQLDLGGPAWLLGTASTDYADDAPLAPGALNLSGHAAADIAALTDALGLPGTAFDDGAAPHYAYEGSARYSPLIDVHAGDTLSFDWRLLAQPTTGPIALPDAAWLLVGDQTIKLGDAASLGAGPQGWLDSGYVHLVHSFTVGGTVRIGFAVADVDSYDATSVLAVRNVALTPAVPEPTGAALALASLGILALTARRAKRA